MNNEHDKKRKNPRKKKKHRLYAAIVLTLGIIIICMSVLILFYVQRIEIKGNEYCTEKSIVEAIQNDRFSINTLYVTAKYATGKGEIPAGLESMEVKLKNPWTLSVTVKEKVPVGYFEYKKEKVYFDKEGVVVVKGYAAIKGIPLIEGADFKNVKLHHSLSCKNSNVFEEIELVTDALKKQELKIKKILYENDRMYVYIGKICVSLGTDITEQKLAQIKPIKEKLGKKKGTLHLENYSSGNETITFTIGEFPEK